MNRIAALLLSGLLLLGSVNLPAAAAADDAPVVVIQYAQELLSNKVAGLIESGFASSGSDANRYKNAAPGDAYHLSGGRRIYTFTEIDPTEGAKPKIADVLRLTDGWLFTADNAAGTPVAMIEVSRQADGSFDYLYGDDAYCFDKCCSLLRDLLAADGIAEEPILIADQTYAFLIRDAAGTERIMPAPSLEREAEAALGVTSLLQLPTGEELFRALQNRKRETDSSSEILYGGSVFQDLAVHPDAVAAQSENAFPLGLTISIVVCAVSAAVAAFHCAVYRKKKKRA